ncbi:hypothetical protein BDR26DRAFT_865464 [Obelidium mucronatum]|nr:hypothetical protein BDR26DRAFT_865464 [Obelidium mucronatum]
MTTASILALYAAARLRSSGHPFLLADIGVRAGGAAEAALFDLSADAAAVHRDATAQLRASLSDFIGARILPSAEVPIKVLEGVVAADLARGQALAAFALGLVSRDHNPLFHLESYFEWTHLETLEDLANHHQRLEKLIPQFDTAIQNLKDAIERNTTMNRDTVQRWIKFCNTQARADVSSSSLFIPPYSTGEFKLSPAEMVEQEKKLRESVKKVFAGYRKLAHFLQQLYLPRVRQSAGVYGLPGYEKAYQAYIHEYCLSNHTANEIQEIGINQILGIQQVMRTVLARDDFRAFASSLRDREKCPELFETDADMAFQKFSLLCNRAFENCGTFRFTLTTRTKGYVMLPVVKLDPEFENEETSPVVFVRYTPIKFAPKLQAIVVNIKKLLSLPNHQWEAIVLNQIYPGAHLQYETSQSIDKETPFYAYLYKTHCAEKTMAWPSYVESCGQELGFYQSPLQHFGKLERELQNAILLVVDTGLHTRNWTIEKAVDFIQANSAYITEEDALELVLQCCESPGKALGPKMGELRLREWRERLEAKIPDSLFREVVTQVMMETEYLRVDPDFDYAAADRFALLRIKHWMDQLV